MMAMFWPIMVRSAPMTEVPAAAAPALAGANGAVTCGGLWAAGCMFKPKAGSAFADMLELPTLKMDNPIERSLEGQRARQAER